MAVRLNFLIPFEQFLFIGMNSHHLPPGDVNVEQCLCVLNEFFHDGKL